MEQKAYEIQISPKETEDSEKCVKFREVTGWQLGIYGAASASTPDPGFGESDSRPKAADNMMFLPGKLQAEPMEQNMVQYCIDQAFEHEKHKVYKKASDPMPRGSIWNWPSSPRKRGTVTGNF